MGHGSLIQGMVCMMHVWGKVFVTCQFMVLRILYFHRKGSQ